MSEQNEQVGSRGSAKRNVAARAVVSAIFVLAVGVAVYIAGKVSSIQTVHQELESWRTDLERLDSRIEALESHVREDRFGVSKESEETSLTAEAELAARRRQQQELAKRRAQEAKALAQAEQELALSPEMQQLRFEHFKSELGVRFGTLYRSLNYSPSQISAFEDVLAERYWTISGLVRAKLSQSMGDGDFADLQRQMLDPLDEKLRQIMGDVGYEQYERHANAGSVQGLIETIAGKFALAAETLTTEQLQQVAQVLAKNTWMPGNDDHGPLGGGWIEAEVLGNYSAGRTAGWSDVSWDGAMDELRRALAPGQMAVLQDLREQTETQRDAKTLRDAVLSEVKEQFDASPFSER